jgi:acyl-CoA reductase-like NAD-dependent aldehyde dehydrogenase
MTVYQDGRLWLAGQRRTSEGHALFAPYDGAAIADVHDGSDAILDAALDAADGARAACAALPTHTRQRALRAIADGIAARAVDFEDTIVREAGKPRKWAKGEVQRAIATFRFAADVVTVDAGAVFALDAAENGVGRTALVRHRPKGVVVAVTPFNFPLNLVAHKLAPAFAAGCPVIVKPAEQTPLTALLLGAVVNEAFAACGVPAAALSVVPCERGRAQRLVTDARVRLVSFTGSDAVGFALRALTPKKDHVLELGGNAAAIVCKDVDGAALNHAVARVVVGAFAYAGQICISVQRVLVHREVFAAFRTRLLAAVDRVVCGDPDDPAVDVGPLISDAALHRVQARVDDAVARGALRLCGAQPTGRVLAPIVVEHAPADCALMTDEIFGPVCTLEAFDDVDDAVALVNASRFGLQTGVFTDDVATLFRCADGLDVGGVIHNDAPTFRTDHMPYGGNKDSGVGREGLPWSLEHHRDRQVLVMKTR